MKEYLPILRAKLGELSALKELRLEVKKETVPVLEIRDDRTMENPKIPNFVPDDIPTFLAKKAKTISSNWKKEFYFDILIDADNVGISHWEMTRLFLISLEKYTAKGYPVLTSLHTGAPKSFVKFIGENYDEVCIRLAEDDLSDPTTLLRLKSMYELPPRSTRLLFDLGSIAAEPSEEIMIQIHQILTSLPLPTQWKSVSVLASSFSLKNLKSASTISIEREEFNIWKNAKKIALEKDINLPYSDYGVIDPNDTEIDWKPGMGQTPKLRYATERKWIVLKGRNLKQYGWEQYHKLAKDLTKLKEYEGNDFCWADSYVEERAHGGPTGNPMTWVKMGTNRHISVVNRQISN